LIGYSGRLNASDWLSQNLNLFITAQPQVVKLFSHLLQLYDQMAVSEISLYNSGKVGLDFVTNLESTCDERQPGKIIVIPPRGHVKALQRQNIIIKYLPGIPTKFKKSFMVSRQFP
jgi:hypothetical protein